MDTSKKMLVLENLIYQYARTQFQLNGVTPIQAHLIMGCVNSKFQESCFNNLLMEGVSIQTPEETEKGTRHTGTKEELVKAFKKTGFTPAEKKEEKNDNS